MYISCVIITCTIERSMSIWLIPWDNNKINDEISQCFIQIRRQIVERERPVDDWILADKPMGPSKILNMSNVAGPSQILIRLPFLET